MELRGNTSCEEGRTVQEEEEEGLQARGGREKYIHDKQIAGRRVVSEVPFHLVMVKYLAFYLSEGPAVGKDACLNVHF